jgi:hypothetical protein
MLEHVRGQSRMHLDIDQRLVGGEARQDFRQHAGGIIVHAAQPHCALDPRLRD